MLQYKFLINQNTFQLQIFSYHTFNFCFLCFFNCNSFSLHLRYFSYPNVWKYMIIQTLKKKHYFLLLFIFKTTFFETRAYIFKIMIFSSQNTLSLPTHNFILHSSPVTEICNKQFESKLEDKFSFFLNSDLLDIVLKFLFKIPSRLECLNS